MKDIQLEVTNKLVAKLEEGNLAPWICPWTKTGEMPIPYNWSTKASYNGINILILWMRATDEGYSRNAWLTYNQAKELGGQVRKGESGVHCIFFKPIEVDEQAEEDEDGKRVFFVRKPFVLFNVDQIDGLQNLPPIPERQKFDENEAVSKLHEWTELYCAKTGLQMVYGGDKAYYSPLKDQIGMPTTFTGVGGYLSTLAHELGHSTGHKKRLGRFDEFKNSLGSAEERYAGEEMTADIFASFLGCELGVFHEEIDQHASYISFWSKKMKEDKTFIFKAAAAASRAHSYFHSIVAAGSADVAA